MAHPKHASAEHDIHELIRSRWSPRAFDASREIPRGELLRLFEAARWAPSSANAQPWRFLVASRDRSPDLRDAMLATLTEKNRSWAQTAPVLVLVAVGVSLERDETVSPMAWYDTGHAVALLTLQATALQLFVRQMEGFDRERAREACGVAAGFEPAIVMAIGYVGDPESLPIEKHRDAERQPRRRRSLAEFTFEGRWGAPLA
jgi:nitroreductase